YPVGNAVMSTVVGTIGGVATTALGVAGYSLLSESGDYIKAIFTAPSFKKVDFKNLSNQLSAKVWNTLSTEGVIVGSSLVCLTALFIYLQNKTLQNDENQFEEDLTRTLADKYGKIATRLNDLESNTLAQGYAKKILQNQLQINQEIENLNLPN